MNKLQRKALEFAYKVYKLNKGWSGFAGDKPTVDTICGLHNGGLIQVNEHRMFSITNFGISKMEEMNHDNQ